MAESNLHPESEQQKRRSARIVQAVPLTVTGVDALGRPFQERTSTLIVNCHGCRYQSKHYVLKNMWVTFEIPHNETGREPRRVRGRVTWIQRPRTVRELFQIGVELEVPGNVWGIAFPPGDWFPYPDAGSDQEIPAPSESFKAETSKAEWKAEAAQAPPAQEPVGDKVRVLPLPAGGDASAQLARQVARMVAEAKQQVQTTVHETATRAVAAETRPLLAALQAQLKAAAEKSVETAVATHLERAQSEMQRRLQAEQEERVTAMRAEWSRELGRQIAEARHQIESQLAEVEGSRQADLEQRIQNQIQTAIGKLPIQSGPVDANAGEVRAAIAEESRRWQELMDQSASDSQARLVQLEETVKRLGEQSSGGTSGAESGWRGLLEADLAAASIRWNESIEATFAEATRRAAEQVSKDSESAAKQIEQQLQQRISVIGYAISRVTAEAESGLGALRDSIGRETAKGEATISQLQQSFEQFEARRGELSSLLQAASDECARHGEALLEAQTNEMNRRAESSIAGIAERLQPVLETAGQQTIERLAIELEQRLAPQIAGASEILSKLAFDREQAEKALAEHQHRIWQVSERSVQDSVARSKELLAQVEKEFVESARTTSARLSGELETKATETTHGTFEALFKSADWYEKKVQTQMQTTLEKGLDQATSILREKAGELSGLFASEIDHYSRSYVEHSQDQIQENARDAAEKAGLQMAKASETAAANFTDRAALLGREQFDQFQSRTNSAFEQSTGRMEAHTLQVRSKLESDARAFAEEFQRVLARHTQQTLELGASELAGQIGVAKESLRVEADSLDKDLRSSIQALKTTTLDDYKQRLENASNSWLLTTVTKLDQQSQGLIKQLAASTEERLKAVCGSAFAEIGETLRQRLSGLSAPLTSPANPAPPAGKPSESDPQEKK